MLEDETLISLTAQTSLTEQPVTGAAPIVPPTGPTISTSVTGAAPPAAAPGPTGGFAPPTTPSTIAPADTTGLQPTTAPLPLPITIVPAQIQTTPTSTGQTAASGAQTGNLVLIGAPDTTSLAGADGNDLLIAPAATAPSATATLQGNAGNDALIGRSGDDVLQGGPGDDMLFGGIGTNQLSGGPGRDLFVFEGGTATIQDFTPADGDQIRITGDAATVSALVASAVATPDGVRLTPETGGSITLLGISPQELSADWFTPTP